MYITTTEYYSLDSYRMMDSSTCTSVVLVLLWVYLCCQALGFFVALIRTDSTSVLYNTITLSTVLLGVCLWQCKKAGYLVSPMTWYHWVLLVLLVLLQIIAVVLEQQGWLFNKRDDSSSYPIYGVAAGLVFVLGCTLFCGWKCNLFCRPCCKSQYVCYGTVVVVVLVVLTVSAVTASLVQHQSADVVVYDYDGGYEMVTISYLSKILLPITQCYVMALIWNTTLKLPYTVPEVVTLVASALSVASILAVAVPPTTMVYLQVPPCTVEYPFLALHLVALGITWYCLEYKGAFYWPKEYMCFGVLAALVILIALVAIVIDSVNDENKPVEYILLGYSLLLMAPTLWYAYRCGLLKWCLPKKKALTATDTAENTIPDTDIAEE